MTIKTTLAALGAAALAALPSLASAQGERESAAGAPASGSAAAKATRSRAQMVAIEVTRDGFVPARAAVKAGQPVTLVVVRKTDRTCATDIVLKDYGLSRPLPLGQPVEVTFTPKKAGPIRYACAMDMVAGTLTAE